ncbi:SDR family NAD(P)-dependent oxidoreductase [Longimicrobium sp.]|uniref:SDR family NAD(P)-dependent oxidoreductase n=1 Tax=Longimicrobium sp. TaxID=2029185 RepID=UPI002D800A69|nr:SDR family NAD(P)-dependent oxidoreductase [Longimicrobium sp.]
MRGRVAVVTGASRGAGRAIAAVLGERGATVYVTGRSSRAEPVAGRTAGTVEDTADEVTARGGEGIAVVCDHTDAAQVEALFERVGRERGRIDVLVNNAWGGYERMNESPGPFWAQPVDVHWRGMFEAGVHAHLLSVRHATPLMLPPDAPRDVRMTGVCARCGLAVLQGEASEPGERGFLLHAYDCVAAAQAVPARALIVSTIAWLFDRYVGNLFYDTAKGAVVRMAWGLSRELRRYGIASVALAPGFMRTERVMEAHAKHPFDLDQTESPEYTGRAVAAMAEDADVMRWTGRVLTSGELARAYGFTDIDGTQPEPFRIPGDEAVPGREMGKS